VICVTHSKGVRICRLGAAINFSKICTWDSGKRFPDPPNLCRSRKIDLHQLPYRSDRFTLIQQLCAPHKNGADRWLVSANIVIFRSRNWAHSGLRGIRLFKNYILQFSNISAGIDSTGSPAPAPISPTPVEVKR
jgi:hypothetical protein